jgi:hypothetical protein
MSTVATQELKVVLASSAPVRDVGFSYLLLLNLYLIFTYFFATRVAENAYQIYIAGDGLTALERITVAATGAIVLVGGYFVLDLISRHTIASKVRSGL